MISESKTRQGASKKAEPHELDTRRCASKDVGPKREWIGGSHKEENNIC